MDACTFIACLNFYTSKVNHVWEEAKLNRSCTSFQEVEAEIGTCTRSLSIIVVVKERGPAEHDFQR
jgi:hypothetical protein